MVVIAVGILIFCDHREQKFSTLMVERGVWGSRNITSLPPLRTKDEIFAFRLSMPKVADLNSLNLRQTSKLPH